MQIADHIAQIKLIKARNDRLPQHGSFEPTHLALPASPGLKLDVARLRYDIGTHIVIGRNNAGKTRLLKAISKSQLTRRFKLEDLDQAIQKALTQISGIQNFPEFEATWGRSFSTPAKNSTASTSTLPFNVYAISDNHKLRSLTAFGREFGETLRHAIQPNLRLRPAIVVPTNRFIRDEGPLNSEQTVDTLETFVPTLENLKRDFMTESTYTTIADAFEDITDGLRLEFRGTSGNSVLHIREGTNPPKRLNECGDGLRDLVVILAFTTIFAEYDLMLDEPGLRLHPHAQRKLLSHLERTTRGSALWIASHDGTFVASSSVRGRYVVQRDTGSATSHVKELPSQDELRSAFYELGWSPQDALLADHVIYCEGPADKIVFDDVVRRLAEKDPVFGGTIVVELGGDGAVWSRKPQVLRSVEFLRRVAPHARHVIVLDKGDETEGSVASLIAWLKPHGAHVRFLKRNELENYFLEPALVEDLLREALRWPRDWFRGDTQNLQFPSQKEIENQLGQRNLSHEKGSSILNDTFQGIFGKKYDKTQGAQTAVAHWEYSAPTLMLEILEEVRSALIETREHSEA